MGVGGGDGIQQGTGVERPGIEEVGRLYKVVNVSDFRYILNTKTAVSSYFGRT